MNTIKMAMEKYVSFLGHFSDPLHVGMEVHVLLFLINWLIIYLLIRGLSRGSKSNFRKAIHEYGVFFSIIFAYFLTAGFIWIKNN